MQLHIHKNVDELSEELAKWIVALIDQTLQSKDCFTIALSGGNTPRSLYEKLAKGPYIKKIPWKKMHFFWGDERAVPFSDERNNAKMAFDTLLNKVDVPAENIHVMRTDIPLQESVEAYEAVLRRYFENSETSFDLVLLGMGADGHTLSLFPGSPVLNDEHDWVIAVYADDQKMYRITLMPAIVNRAAVIAFLVSGVDKSKTLHEVLKGKYLPDTYPSQLIHPLNKQLHWFIDEAAAGDLIS
jgi:6-phosphogluconolactonase